MKNITLESEQKFLIVKACQQWMTPLPSTVGSWSVRNSFIPVTAEMELKILKWLINADLLKYFICRG